jgi:dephospho-CoA kinase
MDAKDVIDIQVSVASLEVADELTDALLAAGYVRTSVTQDVHKRDGRSTVPDFDHTATEALWRKRLFCSADPGRPTNVHIRVDGWPGQQFALLFVDWVMANPAVQAEYLDLKRRAAAERHPITGAYADAKEPWFLDAYRRAWEWADATRWRP